VTSEAADFEALLRRALAPVDPPAALTERLEETLATLTQAAADELEAWEVRAMGDPRNWARPAAAAVVGTTAGAALVLLRARRRRQRRTPQVEALRRAAAKAARDVAEEALRALGGRR
jgi:hypothetical protein